LLDKGFQSGYVALPLHLEFDFHEI